MQTRVWF